MLYKYIGYRSASCICRVYAKCAVKTIMFYYTAYWTMNTLIDITKKAKVRETGPFFGNAGFNKDEFLLFNTIMHRAKALETDVVTYVQISSKPFSIVSSISFFYQQNTVKLTRVRHAKTHSKCRLW